jgi:hypothetical protein
MPPNKKDVKTDFKDCYILLTVKNGGICQRGKTLLFNIKKVGIGFGN